MRLSEAFTARKRMSARRPDLTYVVRRNGRRSPRVSPFFVARKQNGPGGGA